MPGALSHVRICDFTGLLAGAGATRFLAAFGAQVIRIEDPANKGAWDFLRGGAPFLDERRGVNLGGAYNNHNVEKLGITLNVKTPRGKELFTRLIGASDVVTENFAAGVLDRWGFGYERMREIKPDIIYVSNCGFGHEGPYKTYKTFGPSVQALSGLTFNSGLPGLPPAGWGYSYMDHTGGYFMAIAILMALYHRMATGEGQRVDYSTVESAITLNGPSILDYTVNGRPLAREGEPDTNHNQSPRMAPHYVYPANGEDQWVAIACRDDADWKKLAAVIGSDWAQSDKYRTLDGRLLDLAKLDERIADWTRPQDKFQVADSLRAAGVPTAPVQLPEERIDKDERTNAWGLWPDVRQTDMGHVRVDGYPVHMSETDWEIGRGAPNLGEHNEYVYRGLLGLSPDDMSELKAEGTI